MKQFIPRASIKHQPLTTPPFVSDSTLVDDTVALVDSTTSLVGANVTIFPNIHARTKVPTIRTKVKKRH